MMGVLLRLQIAAGRAKASILSGSCSRRRTTGTRTSRKKEGPTVCEGREGGREGMRGGCRYPQPASSSTYLF